MLVERLASPQLPSEIFRPVRIVGMLLFSLVCVLCALQFATVTD